MTGKRNAWLGLLLLVGAAVLFLSHSDTMLQATSEGLQVCSLSILPTLFPFFVLSELWIRLGYVQVLSRLLTPIMRSVFHLPGQSASAMLLGMIGGYPIGARTVAQLYQSGHLTAEQAQQSLFFCNNSGPAFVIGVVGAGVFGSVRIGILLYGIHICSALFIGRILRSKTFPAERPQAFISHPASPAEVITEAVAQAGETALRVCSFVLFFSVITACLQSLYPFEGWTSLLLGTLELAGGVRHLHVLAAVPSAVLTAASFLIGIGGLCAFLQSLSCLHQVGLKGSSLLIGKLLHGLFSAILTWLITLFLPFPITCFAFGTPTPRPLGAILLALFILLWLFLKKTTGKQRFFPL